MVQLIQNIGQRLQGYTHVKEFTPDVESQRSFQAKKDEVDDDSHACVDNIKLIKNSGDQQLNFSKNSRKLYEQKKALNSSQIIEFYREAPNKQILDSKEAPISANKRVKNLILTND